MPLIICRETWNSRAISVAEKDFEQPSPKYRRTTFSCSGLRCSFSSAEMRSRSTAIWMAGYPISAGPRLRFRRLDRPPRFDALQFRSDPVALTVHYDRIDQFDAGSSLDYDYGRGELSLLAKCRRRRAQPGKRALKFLCLAYRDSHTSPLYWPAFDVRSKTGGVRLERVYNSPSNALRVAVHC